MSLNRSIVIRIVIYGPIFFVIYSLVVIYEIRTYSEYLKAQYIELNLKGKNVKTVIELLGPPVGEMKHSRTRITKSGNTTYQGPIIGTLSYYTDIWLINKIGWFPGGGSKFYVGENDEIIGFDEYLK